MPRLLLPRLEIGLVHILQLDKKGSLQRGPRGPGDLLDTRL
jgi:hypothetical protein